MYVCMTSIHLQVEKKEYVFVLIRWLDSLESHLVLELA